MALVAPTGKRILSRSTKAEFLRLIRLNPSVNTILDRLPALETPNTWLVGGCLFQTVWNVLAGHDPGRAIRDYDVFYFDSTDLSREAEEDINVRAAFMFSEIDCEVDVRNQARVHTWYADEFGVEGYPRLTKSTDGIDNFLAVCCMVAVRRTESGGIELYAPLGVEDVLNRIVRPNPWFPKAPRDDYEKKSKRWETYWPDLQVMPFDALG